MAQIRVHNTQHKELVQKYIKLGGEQKEEQEVRRYCAQEHKQVSYSPHPSCLNHTSAPPTAALYVSTPCGAGVWPRVIEFTRFLTFIHITCLRRIRPALVALIAVVPEARVRLLVCFGTAVEWGRGTIPFGMCHSCDRHVGIDRTLHVFLFFGTVVILIRLALERIVL